MDLDPFINLGPVSWVEPEIISGNIRLATRDVLPSLLNPRSRMRPIWDHGVRSSRITSMEDDTWGIVTQTSWP